MAASLTVALLGLTCTSRASDTGQRRLDVLISAMARRPTSDVARQVVAAIVERGDQSYGAYLRRDRTLDEGLAALVATVQPHLGDAAKDIATTIEAAIDWTSSDDIAFVVLKCTNDDPDS